MNPKNKDKNRPICPNCGEQMNRYYYKGYYESFPYWDCTGENCEDVIEIDIETFGAYA